MIKIDGISKTYGETVAVNNLNLQVPRGELFCFLGPNGAGKTTTIKMLTGLVHPDRGQITVAGRDIQTAPVETKRLIGYIPDLPYLYDRLTPVEFIRFVGDLYNIPGPRIDETMRGSFEQFGLASYSNALIGDMSHGMRQRLIYVATFLHEPEVIFIDEPLVGLDPYTIRMIKNLLRRKARDGMTIFLTTHILSVAEEIADRIGIIFKGKLIALGTMEELVERAGTEQRLEDIFLKLTTEEPEPTVNEAD